MIERGQSFAVPGLSQQSKRKTSLKDLPRHKHAEHHQGEVAAAEI
jgi:hypothetical protein